MLLAVLKVKPSKDQPKLSVKFFLHASGNIAAKFLYDQVLPVSTCRTYCHVYELLCLCLYVLFCIRYWYLLSAKFPKLLGMQMKGLSLSLSPHYAHTHTHTHTSFIVIMLYLIFLIPMIACSSHLLELWICRLWMFPISFLSTAEKVLGEISGYNVEVITYTLLKWYIVGLLQEWFF